MRRVVTPQVESHTTNWPAFVVEWGWRCITAFAIDWRWSPLTIGIIGLLPLLIAVGGAVLALLGKDIFKWAVQEDGVVEYLQVLFYCASLIMALLVTRRQWRSGNWVIALLYGILSFGLFFLTGEEISWGQRLLGWATPDQLAAINEQDETNLHNLNGITDLFKWVQLLVGAYGTIFPLAIWAWVKSDRLREWAEPLVPHPVLIPYFALLFVWKLYRNLWPDPEHFKYFLAKYNELMELPLAMGFFFFLLYQMRRSGISTEE
jgi:hypothetical protein